MDHSTIGAQALWAAARRASTSPGHRLLLASARRSLTTAAAPVAPVFLRSVLYVPGANARALERAKSLPADALMLDLEDGSSGGVEVKDKARAAIRASLQAGGFYAPHLCVRINHPLSPYFPADLDMVVAAATAGLLHRICIPKVASRDDLVAVATALSDLGAPPSLGLWAMIETPLGVLNAHAIAGVTQASWDAPALPYSLNALVAGTQDLTADLRARPMPHRMHVLHSLSTIVLAARAHGLLAIDGVSTDVSGSATEAFADEAAQGRSLGFDGKTCIHPSQLGPTNAAFAPSPAELEHAAAVSRAWAEAAAAGKGVATLNGKIVEALHAAESERVLALGHAVAARNPEPGQRVDRHES
jgi:citrate lyase subunit beta/citryl-CoA lyase